MQTDPTEHETVAPGVALRSPDVVMRLARMGAGFATRLSFMRSLIRRMNRERWRIVPTRFELDDEGYGTVVYTAITPERRYSLIGYSQYLEPERRTDRVIAEAWDTTFVLFDGEPSAADVARLAEQVPKQEAGRCRPSELVLSRANKSLRLFDYVIGALGEGRQPDPKVLGEVGYLMRTTAVYGNGKFGTGDRLRYADRPELAGPFRAELLTVYLIRCFTLDLVEHVARRRNPDRFVPLDRAIKRSLGIGNATGLGMAPFLISHPELIHNWYHAREAALARVRSLDRASADTAARFRVCLDRARRHVAEWAVADEIQSARIAALRGDLETLTRWTGEAAWPGDGARPWDALYRRAEGALSTEGEELLIALLLEPHGALIDELAEGLEVDRDQRLDPTMRVARLRALVDRHYAWALAVDYDDPAASHYFWYASEEKLEPRRGERRAEPGADREMPLTVARDVQALRSALTTAPDGETTAALVMRHPDLRAIARRVQIGARHAYAEIRDNLIGADCRPVDILRSKLAQFGASKFDPKSDLWTRITMYQGAPLADELADADADDWCFPVTPEAAACASR